MKIAFCGDLVLRSPEDHKLGSRLKKKLEECKIRVLNFEVPVKVKDGVGIHKSGPVHNQSSHSPEWVMENGFNMVTLANNHSLDYGEKGLQATLKAFKDISITGVGTFETAYKISVFEIDNQKIGFLGLTQKEFGCVDEYSGEKMGTAMATSPRVYACISEGKKTVDKLYVLPHAGAEYLDIPLPEWREVYKSYIDVGADGVIASHPHVPQGWEMYKGCPIFYSLGNFLFEVPDPSVKHPKWLNSLMVVMDTGSDEYEVLPIYYDHKNKVVEIDESKSSKDYMLYLKDALDGSIYPEIIKSHMEYLKTPYKKMMISGGAYQLNKRERLKNLIRPFLGKKRVSSDPVHLLNLFQCESHRWIMMRLLENKITK